MKKLMVFLLLCVAATPKGLFGQDPVVQTWSPTNCETCESTIIAAGWYSDGSGLFMEGLNTKDFGVGAAMAYIEGGFVVAVAIQSESNRQISFNPADAVTIETDSASHMTLYAIPRPVKKLPKDSLTMKQHLPNKSMPIPTGKPLAGYIFFPADEDATRVVVVIRMGSLEYRFPFARKPGSRAKFVNPALVADLGDRDQSAQPPEVATLPAPVPDQRSTISLETHQQHSAAPVSTPTGSAGGCSKNISFAVAGIGGVSSTIPQFTEKWVAKNQKKFPGVCFSQVPNPNAENFVLIFASTASAFQGIYPTVKTHVDTSTNPVSGSGTVTSNYGDVWNYSYQGIVTTTTTTTSQVMLPYTDTTNELFIYGYDERGNLISQRSRSVTTRQGGDAYNTLGYNLGAALGAIHVRERLLADAVSDIAK